MVRVDLELEGSAEDVVRGLRRIVDGAGMGAAAPELGHVPPPADEVTGSEATTDMRPVSTWTEALAADFVAGLGTAARRVVLQVWQAGDAGIHRSALCRRTELSPAELRGLLVSMSHALRRFQRERGMRLSRPVVSNTPLQTYFIDAEFAAVASSAGDQRRSAGR